MSSSTILLNSPGTYDLNGNYSGYGTYAIDCSAGNIILTQQQASFSGIYYQIIRIDQSLLNTLTLNAYPGDTMNGSLTTTLIPINTNIWCQTVAAGNWLVPKETVSYL
jgi:hypothetical protein